MKLLLITGDTAVGKMTVGQELCKITPFRLFHNHMSIEPVIEIFGEYDFRICDRLRQVIFDEFAKSDNYGLIFTFLWAFDEPGNWEYVSWVRGFFEKVGAEIYCVELIAPQSVRLERNRTANRLAHKASKRDLAFSEARLLLDDVNHRCVSYEGEIDIPNYLRIDNSHISAADCAAMIKAHFAFDD